MDSELSLAETLMEEMHIFAVPLAVLAVGLGLSFLSFCKKKVSKMTETYVDNLTCVKTEVQTDYLEAGLPQREMETNEATVAEEKSKEETVIEDDSSASVMVLEDNVPSPRVGAGAVFDCGDGIFTVAGGMQGNVLSGDVHMYSVEEEKWTDYKSKGKQGFVYASVGILDQRLVVFGGIGEDRKPRDTLVQFDFENSDWVEMPLLVSSKPAARFNSNFSWWYNDSSLVLFGGRDQSSCFNDIWRLSMIEGRALWDCLYAQHTCDDEEEVNSEDENEEYVPVPREGHTAVILHNMMLVLGGTADNGDFLNPSAPVVEVFDLDSKSWNTMATVGEGPTYVSSGGSAHAVRSSNKIIVISGQQMESFFNDIYILDASSLFEKEQKTTGETALVEPQLPWSRIDLNWCGDPTMPISSRLYFAAALDECEGFLYLLGGLKLAIDEAVPAPPQDSESSLEPGMAVFDFSGVMRIRDAPWVSVVADSSAEDSAKGPEGSEKDINKDGTAVGEEDEEEDIHPDTEPMDDVGLDDTKLFSNLGDLKAASRLLRNVENETIDDFEKIKEEIDIEFAKKYLSAADIANIKMRSSIVGEDILIQNSYPMPK